VTPAAPLVLALVGSIAILVALIVTIARASQPPDAGRVSGGWLARRQRDDAEHGR
jgi:hypothetical protein